MSRQIAAPRSVLFRGTRHLRELTPCTLTVGRRYKPRVSSLRSPCTAAREGAGRRLAPSSSWFHLFPLLRASLPIDHSRSIDTDFNSEVPALFWYLQRKSNEPLDSSST